MAAHLQQQILDALQAALVAAGTAAGTSVYVDHPDELTAAMLPAIVIESGPEQVAVLSQDWPFLQQRRFEFSIGLTCQGADADAAARDIGRAVEAALNASIEAATCGGITEPLELTGIGKQKTGQARTVIFDLMQTWETTYYTRANAPDVPVTL